MASLFDAQVARIREQRSLFAQGEGLVRSARAQERMRRMLDLHDFWLDEIAGVVDRWRQR